METTQSLKKRLKSVGNIGKITKAMEMVAAVKMRKAQEIALASRPYSFAALDLLSSLSFFKTELPLFFENRSDKSSSNSNNGKTLFVVVTSDKGLAGSFNSSLFRKFEKYVLNDKVTGDFVAVGEKSFNYLSKKGFNIVKKFTWTADFAASKDTLPLADFLINGYDEKKWDKVIVFSSHFKSALKQEPLLREILPVSFESIKETVMEIVPTTGKFAELMKENNLSFTTQKNIREYLIEPSPRAVLENLVRHLLFMQVYHLILEANASEHSSRRLAMKTASDNAADLSEKLNLKYNKSRQAGITNQIIEISSGVRALAN